MPYKLLTEFENLFKGKKYLHRNSSLGDFVAMHLFEDLYDLGKSLKLKERINSKEWVVNTSNRRQGIKARRGDGTFGEIVPGEKAVSDPGYSVARGIVATLEIGAEVKIISKAMIKQIDRVVSDLQQQAHAFDKRASTMPISIGIVGINNADYVVAYEGDREYKTDGKANPHPFQEAAKAGQRLREHAATHFNEFLILHYKATNDPPFDFNWTNQTLAEQDYGASLLRICREYDRRF